MIIRIALLILTLLTAVPGISANGPTIPADHSAEADTLALTKESESKFPVVEMASAAGAYAFSALFIGTKPFVDWRTDLQKHISQNGAHKTKADNYLRYVPFAMPFVFDVCGLKGEHRILDKALITGISFATVTATTQLSKVIFNEKRPDSEACNSFPSGHVSTVVAGAEIVRREYWNSNKWVAMSGYLVAATVAYLRIHNNRHWINDVVGGAALGYMSTTFAYWIYPKIFPRRAAVHRRDVLDRMRYKKSRAGEMIIAAPYVSASGAGMACTVTF